MRPKISHCYKRLSTKSYDSITSILKCYSFAVLVEPPRNAKEAFKVRLWPEHKLNQTIYQFTILFRLKERFSCKDLFTFQFHEHNLETWWL